MYELILHNSDGNYPTLENSLFGAVKLTRGTDIDNYKYFGCGIGFDRKGFLATGDDVSRNVIILGVDMSSSPHFDIKGKDILILGKGPTQGLGEHSLTAEKIYSINFTKENTKFCLSLHYNGANSYLFVKGTKIIKFKAKDSEIVPTSLCLGNITKEFSEGSTKKTGRYCIC